MVPRRSAAYHLDGTMLRRLRIENLVLIHEAELAFAPGLNAITGETGAGKTILAQAIGLLLGAKGDAAYIGPDGAEAYVEAELDLPPGLLEEEEFAVVRRASSRGRGRAARRPPRLRGRADARVCLGARRRARGPRRSRGAADRDVGAVRAAPARPAGVPARCARLVHRRRPAAAARRIAGRLARAPAARRRHEELQPGAVAAEARLAELRALVEDTTGFEPDTEETLRARAGASSARHRARRRSRGSGRRARSRRGRRCGRARRKRGARACADRVARAGACACRRRAAGRRAAPARGGE